MQSKRTKIITAAFLVTSLLLACSVAWHRKYTARRSLVFYDPDTADNLQQGSIVSKYEPYFTKVNVVPDRPSSLTLRTKSGHLSLIHISEPTRLLSISYAVFC